VGLFQKFIAKLGNKEEAIKAAVKYCSKHDILEGFLEMHGSEVLNMLLTEWNTEDCIAVRCEEAREDAIFEIARKMKNAGKPVTEIEKFTGLSYDAINQLGC